MGRSAAAYTKMPADYIEDNEVSRVSDVKIIVGRWPAVVDLHFPVFYRLESFFAPRQRIIYLQAHLYHLI